MPVVKLHGGQGNQLFQYAYGISKYGGEARFDRSFKNDFRHYELDQWNLPIAFEASDSAEVGYWQDERFFDKRLIRRLFERPKGEPNIACWDVSKRIVANENSCFIGVRRSDYLWPERIHYHGVLPIEYYYEALADLTDLHKELTFFVFTDDLQWAEQHFKATIVDVNGPNEKAWDIWLMSLCKHAILANSSFHWWGSFLGPDKNGGTVIAPKHWFVDEKVNSECRIVPDRWIRI